MTYSPHAHTTILVVEDDFFIRDLLVELLEDEGYPVVSAANGKEALAYLQANDDLPRLILLDLMMPVMDGQQFRRAQLADPRLDSIPVVVLTASSDNDNLPDMLHPATYMSKPIELHHLLETVAAYSHGHSVAYH